MRHNDWGFAFKYLKESFRITVHALSGHPTKCDFHSVRVKTDKSGLPKIIPAGLRNVMLSSVRSSRIALTMLQVYRIFPFSVPVDLKTIIGPFTGISRTLPDSDIIRAGKELRFRPRFKTFRGFLSDKAGPNCKRASFGIVWDAFAFYSNPKLLYSWILLSFRTRSGWYLFS